VLVPGGGLKTLADDQNQFNGNESWWEFR